LVLKACFKFTNPAATGLSSRFASVLQIAVDGIYEYGRNLSPIIIGGKENVEWLRGRKGTQGKLLNGEW
jgi:hypothetical protein